MAKSKDQDQELSVLVYDLVQDMKQEWDPVVFFERLMKIYGTANASIEQVLNNDLAMNVASPIVDDTMERPDLAIRQRAYFRFLKDEIDVVPAVEKVQRLKELNNQKYRFQFIIACSAKALCLYDLVQNDKLSIDLDDLPDYYSFLLPMNEGRRDKIVFSKEADIKACSKLTRLLDTLAKHNHIEAGDMQQLNSFMRRILFCFFAEDTGIFSDSEEHMFTNAFDKLVDKHGSNAKSFFENLFTILNTKPEDKEQYRHRMANEIYQFPYVNGGLFQDVGYVPEFGLAARNQFMDCGSLSWKEVSPAIFGSMFQNAMDKEKRRNMGAHYTSEENIMKVIKPLFLDKLYSEFEQLKIDTAPMLQQVEAATSWHTKQLSKKLQSLDLKRKQVFKDFLARIGKMKFLDPACGCGNFLLIAYKELRTLENEVYAYINEGSFTDSYISINQFYGIEIEDWPAEIASVSMWLMQHLMNQEANTRFGSNIKSIPLKTSATIVRDNALTRDWNKILPASECSYILGNPPFSGTTNINDEQRIWLRNAYPAKYKVGRADFVTAWFIKASNYMEQNKRIETGFVATNSICQGEQVATLWGLLLSKGVHINFAYSSFPWKNEAADKAGVTCVIVGFAYNKHETARLFNYDKANKVIREIKVNSISPYLTSSSVVIVKKTNQPLSNQPNILFGNMPVDGGNLIFDYKEGKSLLSKSPELEPFIKKLVGSSELMKGEFRYCLWLVDHDEAEWSQFPFIKERVEQCKKWRSDQKKTGDAFKLRDVPWKFRSSINPASALVIPAVTSENRYYVPMDFVKDDTVINNGCFILPCASHYDFAILTSRMHMCWMKLTCGKLESRYRYSRDLTYNTFVWPECSDEKKLELENLAKQIRLIRAGYPKKSLAELYHFDTMPDDLREAHEQLDLAVEKAYRAEPFADDEERLAFLLDLYAKAVGKEGQ